MVVLFSVSRSLGLAWRPSQPVPVSDSPEPSEPKASTFLGWMDALPDQADKAKAKARANTRHGRLWVPHRP